MNNPYENNNTTNGGYSNPSGFGAQWNSPNSYDQPGVNAQWNGTNYHSGPTGFGGKPPKEKKPRKGLQTWHKIVIAVLSCMVISAGSVGTFAALISTGAIPISNTTSTQTSSQSNSIGQTTNTGASSETAVGELTKQQVAEKVIPSVVCIQAFYNNTSGFGFSQSQTTESEGSGVIATSDGYIITNAHVVDGATSVKVVLSDNTTYEGKIIGVDTSTDLALIKIEATNLTAAEFGSSADLKVADTVMAIGNPGGLAFQSSVAVGYISALNRVVSTDTAANMKCIQTDAAINPGNSGGALVNMQGQVIGINSSKLVATSYEGIGFAIPIDDALPIINDLREYGYVKNRGVLNISGQYVDSITARFNGLSASGFYVSKIKADSVKQEGLQEGDVITSIDGQVVTSLNTISSALQGKKPGETVTLIVARGNTTQTLTITLSESSGSSSAQAGS